MNGQILLIGSLYQDRLRDESRLCGSADTISFPDGNSYCLAGISSPYGMGKLANSNRF